MLLHLMAMLMAFSFVYPVHSVRIWLYHTGKMVKIWFINIINAHFKFLIFYYLNTKTPLYEARTCGGIFRVTIEAIIDSHKKSNIVFIGYLLTIFFKVISINARVRNDEITCEPFLLPFTHRISRSLILISYLWSAAGFPFSVYLQSHLSNLQAEAVFSHIYCPVSKWNWN